MTNTLIDTNQQTPAPPFLEVRRRQKRGTLLLTAAASVMGTLLIAGAFLWNGLNELGDAGQSASVASSTATSAVAESVVASESSTLTTAALTATGLNDVSDIAARTVDSIVVVQVTIDARGPVDATGSGSGVIISEDGLIVTNAHVVEGATSITVELTDGSTFAATVLAENTDEDIAVLDIQASGLTTVELGSTSDLAVGDPVVAIGNPLALEGGPSVSTGIVSALDRELADGDATLTGIIQTDAAITEGSSGGALLDAEGRLIGITTAVGVSRVGVEGIAFAVPVETVNEVLSGLDGV